MYRLSPGPGDAVITLLQQLVNGISVGALYALWAVGYGLVYQVMRLHNLGFGDLLTLALFIVLALLSNGLPVALSVAIGLLSSAVISVLGYLVVYRPLISREQSLLAFMAGLGIAFVADDIVILGWGTQARAFPQILPTGNLYLGQVRIGISALIGLGIAILIVGTVQVFLTTTRIGRGVRATAQDRMTAGLMGISSGRITIGVYGFAGIIGMVGAFFYTAKVGVIATNVGFTITIKAWMAAVIGGIGRGIYGAVVGGVALGLSESLIEGYISVTLVDALLAAVLVVFLIFRPNGIVGIREEVKL